MSKAGEMKSNLRFLTESEFSSIRENDQIEFEAIINSDDCIIESGKNSFELRNSKTFQDFMSNDQEIILSSLPISDQVFKKESIRKLMKSSSWHFNYPVGIISDSLIKIQTYKWHLLNCPNCSCSLAEVVSSVLSSGLRQIFSSDVIDFDPSIQNGIDHPVMSEILASLSIMDSGITIAVDGERIDSRYTGTNRIAVQLLNQLQKSEFVKSIDVLIPYGYEPSSVDLKANVIQVNTKPNFENSYDVLFRPNQSWEPSWLVDQWNRFNVHVQWWLDFISFETPEYAGGVHGISHNLENARWAFSNYESTLFLSPSCERKSVCLGTFENGKNGILPCTIEQKQVSINSHRERIILVVGNSFVHKSRVYVLRLFERLIEVEPDFRLVLIGGNPGFASSDKVEDEIYQKSSLLASKVLVLGKVSEEILLEYYKKAMFVFSPSTVEGFGLVPFEASNYGVTPLTSRIDAWEDYLNPDYWLDLFSIEKSLVSILQLLASEEARQKQIGIFQDWARENNWEYLGNKCLLHFARTMSVIDFQEKKNNPMKLSYKNLIKRSRAFVFLMQIRKFINNV